jgi:hypothetical protein
VELGNIRERETTSSIDLGNRLGGASIATHDVESMDKLEMSILFFDLEMPPVLKLGPGMQLFGTL